MYNSRPKERPRTQNNRQVVDFDGGIKVIESDFCDRFDFSIFAVAKSMASITTMMHSSVSETFLKFHFGFGLGIPV